MRIVINGLAYDTSEAELLAKSSFGDGSEDPAHFFESLYKTREGRYFIAGSGGENSRWRQKISPAKWVGGSGIKAITETEARQWVEDHINEQYEAIFGSAEDA